MYKAKWTPELEASLTACRHAQRAVYNMTVAAVPEIGGPVPAKQKSPAAPDGLLGQLTTWRAELAWLREVPVALARPAVAQARLALRAHEDAVSARTARLLKEQETWATWTAKHAQWNTGTWNALPVEDKREAAKRGEAPPRSETTWRDERAGDGIRRELFRRKKRQKNTAVSFDTPPKRIDANTLRLPGVGKICVKTHQGLPEANRLKAARVCVRNARRAKTRVEVHLSVTVDVTPRKKRTHRHVAGTDMGCSDAVTLHDGRTLKLPNHDPGIERCLKAHKTMNQCKQGSRQWTQSLDGLRAERRGMRHRDRNAVRKFARALAHEFNVVGLEGLNISGMGASARARASTAVAAKQALNRKIRASLWGFTQHAIASAMESAGGRAVTLPAMDSSRTDSACGHVDAKNREGKTFRCTRCGRTADADVNAASVMRQRAMRWEELRAGTASDKDATDHLWKELREARKRSEKTSSGNSTDARARTKPGGKVRCNVRATNGGAGASSAALARAGTPHQGSETGSGEGNRAGRHEELSQTRPV